MIAFYRAYPTLGDFLPQPVAKNTTEEKMPQAVAKTDCLGISGEFPGRPLNYKFLR